MSRYQHEKRETGIQRASEWSGEARRSVDSAPGLHGHDLRGLELRVHRAVVSSVPAATGWQACTLAAIDESRQRPEAEKQDEKNGESAPHLNLMINGHSRTAQTKVQFSSKR
jgi:hypothetical protein